MDAFLSRYFLIEAADRTLDLQYYMFHEDETGMLLMERIIAAANRVRVRLLFDDRNIAGKDFDLLMFNASQNGRSITIFPSRAWFTTICSHMPNFFGCPSM